MSRNNNTALTHFCNLQASSFSVIYSLLGSAGVLMKSGLCRQLWKGIFQVESPLNTTIGNSCLLGTIVWKGRGCSSENLN